ncbi:MAG: acyl-CoA dehydrogenase family protein [Holophagales bacterium]|nr:acyl-CoA dehydrogenase family protein [Holophagales bacterium]
MGPNETSSTPPSRATLDDPRLLPFLPSLYMAWSDGDLADEEIDAICPGLDSDCIALLGPWLDSRDPPTAAELATMKRLIRRHAAELDRRQKLDLTGLGLAIAQAHGGVESVERQALEHLQQALGIHGTEAARQLLTTRRPAHRQREADPAFDLPALRRLLEGEHSEVRRRTFEILGGEGFEHPYDLPIDERRELTLRWTRALAESGLGALSYPESCGGADDLGGFITLFEAICCFDLGLAVKAGVQFGLWGGSVLNLGTRRHHEEWLPKIASLELPGCFAMTETGHGSNVADLETTARFDPETGDFVLHTPHEGARKDYIGNAALHGEMATVFAQLVIPEGDGEVSHGVHAFVVPIRDAQGRPLPGVRITDCGPKMGLDGVDNGRLFFDSVHAPRENLLDRFAQVSADGSYTSPIASPTKRFFIMLGTLVGGRVSLGLGALSAAKTALFIAVRYGAKRRQFGPLETPETRLLDYPTHQRRLMPRLAATYALHFALADLRRRYVASDPLDRRDVEARAAGLKAVASWHATDTLQTCRECCGGQGYLAENRFADLKADSDIFSTFEGDNIVLLQLLAKWMLGGYKRQFGRMKPLGLVRWVAERAATDLAERNPVTVRLTSEEHLLDREFHLAAFAWRERHLLHTVARRLQKRLGGGMEMSQALLECQIHLVDAARAWTEHTVLERFDTAIREAREGRAGDPATGEGVAEILSRLCDLYALSRIHADRGFFQEHGYLEGMKARAIRDQMLRLCAELRGQAVPLVEAFGLPEALVDAPIAR